MSYLELPEDELERLGAIFTAKEIAQQPVIWQRIFDDLVAQRSDLREFINHAVANTKRIIISGAGTSSYIGISLTNSFQKSTSLPAHAIPSTDIVANPEHYFVSDIPTFLISFARSGESPESVAIMKLADEICEQCFHLVVLCNGDSKLGAYKSINPQYVFLLPKEANDQSLAMTSSYSGMLFAGLLLARINDIENVEASVAGVIGYANRCLKEFVPRLKKMAERDYKRAVFLGSGALFGTATEAQLKLQELTDGKIICKNETYLGFRHGPKAVVDGSTLVVYFISANNYTMPYERDLIQNIDSGISPLLELAISENEIPGIGLENTIIFSETEKIKDEDFLTVSFIVPSQILAFYKSLHMGLKPDRPSVLDSITRVVEGVRIYDYKMIQKDKALV